MQILASLGIALDWCTLEDVIRALMIPMNSTESTSLCTSEAQFFIRESSTSKVRYTVFPLLSNRRLRNSLIAFLALFDGSKEWLELYFTENNRTHETFFVLTSSTISKMVSQSGSDKSPLVAFSTNQNVKETWNYHPCLGASCSSPNSCLKFTISETILWLDTWFFSQYFLITWSIRIILIETNDVMWRYPILYYIYRVPVYHMHYAHPPTHQRL